MKKIFFILIIPLAVIILYYPALFTYFSQDDFFHFKVSITDGSISQLVNLFGFHSFSERGIAFYRPIFREAIFNIFYSIFGLNPYPFRIFQFSLLFLNSVLIYHLIFKLLERKYLSFFAAFFYAISSAQVASLYYLAGGIQVLGATTFLLLTLLLSFKNLPLSFITFLFALASHELTSVIPFLISALLFVRYPFKQAMGKIWQIFPFFFVLIIYLYLEITKIGFSAGEKQYQVVFNLKTILNSYMWYIGWALGLPEMLVDFVLPGFKLNPNLFKYWGNYYLIIFISFFSILIILLFSVLYLFIKKRIFLNKTLSFFTFWFFASIIPVVLLPLHKSTQYLETGLAAFFTIIGIIIFDTYKCLKRWSKNTAKVYLFTIIALFISLSATSVILQKTTFWAAERGKYAKKLIEDITTIYPNLPKGALIYFRNDPNYPYVANDWGSSSKQAALILNNEDALRLIYKDPTLKVYYEDISKPPQNYSGKIYSITAKIY